jgi:ribosomal 50S subunit-recycling heat shock protein
MIGGRCRRPTVPTIDHRPPITGMRLDLFLKQSRLIPRRTVAQEACDAGAVTVNGATGKPGRSVAEGDVIAIRQRGKRTTVRVVRVPQRPPSKAEAPSLYETLGVESYEE